MTVPCDNTGVSLPAKACRELDEAGFTLIPGPVPSHNLARLAASYDEALSNAVADDIKVGSSTTRVRDFVNRGPEFDALYLHPPVLMACHRILNQNFRLSTMHARTLRPGMPAQNLHVDYERDPQGWTMVGFIFMVDDFTENNGATRFIPGSHLCANAEAYPGEVACGQAGTMIVFNGSVWHGHTANRTSHPRRSMQGAYIRRDAGSGEDLRVRMLPETLSRLSPLAKCVLAI